MAAEHSETAVILCDVRFEAAMNREQIAAVETATSMRLRGVHDPDRRMPGTGFLDADGAPVMLALHRERDGWRIVALTHEPERVDREAVRTWRDRVIAAVSALATSWREESRDG